MRYLGQKLWNWPAAVLIFGWMALTLTLLSWEGDRFVSLFGRRLVEPPIFWWPEMSGVGFLLIATPMVLGAVALYVMPKVDWSARVGSVLVALGAVSFIVGVAWDAGSGVAVYEDRVVYADAGFGQPQQVSLFSEAQRIETSCVMVSQRGGSRYAEPRLTLVFAEGRRIDLWSRGLGGDGGTRRGRIPLIRLAHAIASDAGAVRAPTRRPDGSLIGDPGCVGRLANELDVRIADIAPLFSVDQSELRPTEYVIGKEV